MRETTWLSASAQSVKDTAGMIIGELDSLAYVDFSIPYLIEANVRVYAKSTTYRLYLERNFPPPNVLADIPLITLYYSDGDLNTLEAAGFDLTDITTPCVGLFDEVSSTGFIVGMDEYGLLKSTVVGMHSRLLFNDGFMPIHGAVVDVNGQGVVITGNHGAGKSTALFNIVHRASGKFNIRVLTDDWAVAKKVDTAIRVTSIERNMSFSESLVLENPELELSATYSQHILHGIGKAWVEVEQCLGGGTFTEFTTLNKVLVFSKGQSKDLICPIDKQIVAALLADSSYHMPDSNIDPNQHLIDRWRAILKEVECFEINLRQASGSKDEIYQTIIDHIRT